jgi:hypothetical protein
MEGAVDETQFELTLIFGQRTRGFRSGPPMVFDSYEEAAGLGQPMMEIRCETGEVVSLPEDPSVPVIGLDLHRAVLIRTGFRGRRFVRCSFRNALCGLSRFDHAEFVDCTLALAEFDGASLVSTRFSGGVLNGASLHGVSLADPLLEAAALDGASSVGANLDGARFETGMAGVDLRSGLYTSRTRWPDGFDVNERGGRLIAGT